MFRSIVGLPVSIAEVLRHQELIGKYVIVSGILYEGSYFNNEFVCLPKQDEVSDTFDFTKPVPTENDVLFVDEQELHEKLRKGGVRPQCGDAAYNHNALILGRIQRDYSRVSIQGLILLMVQMRANEVMCTRPKLSIISFGDDRLPSLPYTAPQIADMVVPALTLTEA